jgi:hypothetical protein
VWVYSNIIITLTDRYPDAVVNATPTTEAPPHDYFPIISTDLPSSRKPTVHCKIDNCTQYIELIKSSIRRHLIDVHGYEAYQRGVSVECLWENCRCTRNNCRGRGLGHSVHVQDIAEHVWHAHLNFHEACSKCGDARWVHPFARSRHESTCTGPRPARCKRCLIEFSSIVALESHILLGQCFCTE